MTVQMPDRDDLEIVSAAYGLGLSTSELAEFSPHVKDTLASWDVVADLHREIAPPTVERAWAKPADNSLGAWYVTCDITSTGEGPLAGRAVGIKDNIAVAGVPMMNGSALVEGYVPNQDATVVTRLLAAGATITGKTVCENLCFSGASHTAATGPVRNPWDHTRTSGGSSSGSAALVASGAVDLAIGGDQGGSVRLPAAFTGIVGHKPTHGLVPYTGAFPIEQSLDHLGPMTRTVADAALVLDAIAGPDGLDPRQRADSVEATITDELTRPTAGLRVGVLAEGFGHPESVPGVDAAVRGAIDVLRAEGLLCESVSIPWHRHGQTDLGCDRRRRWYHPDGRRQRLRQKLAGLVRPCAHRALRQPTPRRWLFLPGHREAGVAGWSPHPRSAPRRALCDGTQPRSALASRIRRGPVALRCPRHAHHSDPGQPDTGQRRATGGIPGARIGDDGQHRRFRRDGPSCVQRPGRPGRRTAGRDDDRGPPPRRCHGAAGGTHLRAGPRGFPAASNRAS
jgi:hypothetical protein